MEERVRKSKQKKKNVQQEDPANVKLSCRGCSKYVCTGEDIQIIDNMHRVNLSTKFR